MRHRKQFMALAVLAFAAVAEGSERPQVKLPLDELLDTPISTAAKYDQQLSRVAASVTVISAEEIERYGWTTLPEALASVSDLYLTNDRNFTYVGVRGIGRPTDYNSRLLLLLDGQPLNGAIFGGAPVDLPI